MTQDQHNGVTILTVAGNLSGAEAAAVRHALQTSDFAMEESVAAKGLVVDLDRCQFIDSDGLEALLLALKKAEARSIPAKLVLHDSNCRLILQLTRLDHRFDCCDDLPSALKMMN
jgi:anti-anti-sigma factor